MPWRLGYSTGPTVQVTEAHFFPDFQFDNFGWKSVWNVKILKKLLKLSVLDVTTYSALPCPGQPVLAVYHGHCGAVCVRVGTAVMLCVCGGATMILVCVCVCERRCGAVCVCVRVCAL